MQFKLVLFSFLSILTITILSNESFAQAKKAKRKPGVVLKNAGYYCPIEKIDKVMIKPTTEVAVAAATTKGYLAPEVYFQTLCETTASNPHVLVPKEILSFDFSIKYTGDKVATSKLNFSKGVYKLSISCENEKYAYTYLPGSANIGVNSNDKSNIVELTNQISGYFEIGSSSTPHCTGGKLTVERLS